MAENISNLLHLHNHSSSHGQNSQQQTSNDHMKLLFNMFQRGDMCAKSLDTAFEYFESSLR